MNIDGNSKYQIPRRHSHAVKVGKVTLGAGNPVVVQGMANVPTRMVDECLEQVAAMVDRGCEMVRLAVPGREDTAAIGRIVQAVSVPVIADVHFHYARALEAIEAGVHKIRLNPGNIADRRQVEQVIAACKQHGTAIRVGVNQGSIRSRKAGGVNEQERQQDFVNLMLDKMAGYVRIFEDNGFDNLVLSAKCHDARHTIMVNRALAERFSCPLHLGITHAGTLLTGSVRSAVGLGALLAEGIGDTIRVSLAGNPVREIDIAWEILNTLGLRKRRAPELIVCPTCGRTEIDIENIADKVSSALQEIHYPVRVAVMGCIVNGPGEADDADVALCGGHDRAVIYRNGVKQATVSADRAVEALVEQVKIFIRAQSINGQ